MAILRWPPISPKQGLERKVRTAYMAYILWPILRKATAIGPSLAAPSPRFVRSQRADRRRFHSATPRLQVPAIAAATRLDRPTLAIGAELKRLATSRATRCAAVRHHPGASQLPPRPVHLCRNVMRPRVRSYGDTASVTRSPASTRMRNRRILPAIVAST